MYVQKIVSRIFIMQVLDILIPPDLNTLKHRFKLPSDICQLILVFNNHCELGAIAMTGYAFGMN